jgi:hypothetical protein
MTTEQDDKQYIFQSPKLLAVSCGETSYGMTTNVVQSFLHQPLNSTAATHLEIQSLRTASFINSYGFHAMIKGETFSGEQQYYAFGSNSWNELSFTVPPHTLQNTDQKKNLEQVTPVTFEGQKYNKGNIQRMAFGFLFTAILLDDNRLFIYGTTTSLYTQFELNHDYLKKYKVREMATSFYELYILFENDECIYTDREKTEFQFQIYKDIHTVVPGGYYCTFIKTDGTLCGIGSGANGEYANDSQSHSTNLAPFLFQNDSVRDAVLPATKKVKFISTAWTSTLVVTHDNRIFGCGAGISQKLIEIPYPELTQKGIAKVLGYFDEFMFLTNDRQVYLYGKRGYGIGHSPTQSTFNLLSLKHLEDKIRGLEILDIGGAYNANYVLFGMINSNEQIKFWKQLHGTKSFSDVQLITQE